ncbi:MAG: glycosyltransferase family 2 protein, partial [Candidatus Dormibacteria bacterium]
MKTIIAVIIPCYKVTRTILDVLKDIPLNVDLIYCVDDGCPDHSGDFIVEKCSDKRVRVLRCPQNQGVGGATIAGYKQALLDEADIIVKIDGDGQMDPKILERFIHPIQSELADYTKGNRFYRLEDIYGMPKIRIIGNALLSFLTKFSTGYWQIFDPSNGYTAIHKKVLEELPMDRISKRWFFEPDMLFRLNIVRAVVLDIPMRASYQYEKSNLKIRTVIPEFIFKHTINFLKRIFYNYFLRDFSVASLEFLLGIPLIIFGIVFSISHWVHSISLGTPASAGTVMIGG